uniref:CSab-Uro-1 n=1 Tax=Urodacus manicatus TaxID=1330407 RepID=T1DPA4_UROMN
MISSRAVAVITLLLLASGISHTEADGKFIRHKDRSFYECFLIGQYNSYCVDAGVEHEAPEKCYCKSMEPFQLPGGCFCPKLPTNKIRMCSGALASKC